MHVFDTAYIKTEDQGEGPFLFWFQAEYEQGMEGTVGLVLYKYDRDTLRFQEIEMHSAQEGQSMILTVIEEGTYVLKLETMSSTYQKYGMDHAL